MKNDDLAQIEQMILDRKQVELLPASEIVSESSAPTQDHAGMLVESAFNQAVVHKVATDESVRDDLLESAGDVIRAKTNAIRERADTEEKTALFHNKRGACECFGYTEDTTEKWAVRFMGAWHCVMTLLWIVIGMLSFAPIVFVAKKIVVIFKNTFVAVMLSIIVYLAVVVGLPVIIGLLG